MPSARRGLSWDPLQEASNLLDLFGLRLNRAAALLGIHRRSVARLRLQPADPSFVAALRLQLGLRAQQARRALAAQVSAA